MLLLYEFRLGHAATEAANNICRAVGVDAVSVDTAWRWFDRFRNGEFGVDDLPRSGRPQEVDVGHLEELVESEPRLSSRCLAESLGCSHVAVELHLMELGKVWKYGVWIPHELTPHQLQVRIGICMCLLTSHRNFRWLYNLVTGDEKWVLYINYMHQRQWLSPGQRGMDTPRTQLTTKKALLSVWWNSTGVIHWELLPSGHTVNAVVYCQQLDRVAEKLKGKQDLVYFLHDNARPHVATMTRDKLLELKWKTLPHPPYSPDLAPTDYHLFRSLTAHLSGKTFNDNNELESELGSFFDQKTPDFYERGIMELPQRWRQVVDGSGVYLN